MGKMDSKRQQELRKILESQRQTLAKDIQQRKRELRAEKTPLPRSCKDYLGGTESDGIDESEFRRISDQVIDLQARGITREVRIAYTNFRSTFEQEAAVHKILPVSLKIMESIVASITPVRGKYAELPSGNAVPAYTIEPDAEEVFQALIPKLASVAVFHKLLESKASEHSARMVAMKSATDKAKEMAQELTRTFNKVRQAAITREVSEITSGIEAMR